VGLVDHAVAGEYVRVLAVSRGETLRVELGLNRVAYPLVDQLLTHIAGRHHQRERSVLRKVEGGAEVGAHLPACAPRSHDEPNAQGELL
jgi:hypothetical protein